MSLGPAIAAAAGFLVLGQSLSLVQVLAIGLVVAASGAAVRTRTVLTDHDRPEPGTVTDPAPHLIPRGATG
jgi:threonine/homoserine efflux transporter RhtA